MIIIFHILPSIIGIQRFMLFDRMVDIFFSRVSSEQVSKRITWHLNWISPKRMTETSVCVFCCFFLSHRLTVKMYEKLFLFRRWTWKSHISEEKVVEKLIFSWKIMCMCVIHIKIAIFLSCRGNEWFCSQQAHKKKRGWQEWREKKEERIYLFMVDDLMNICVQMKIYSILFLLRLCFFLRLNIWVVFGKDVFLI